MKIQKLKMKYVYWEDLFKTNQSVLYLPLKDTDKTFQWTEILFSFAAGIAMFISLMLGFAVANSFSQNTTLYSSFSSGIYLKG